MRHLSLAVVPLALCLSSAPALGLTLGEEPAAIDHDGPAVLSLDLELGGVAHTSAVAARRRELVGVAVASHGSTGALAAVFDRIDALLAAQPLHESGLLATR